MSELPVEIVNEVIETKETPNFIVGDVVEINNGKFANHTGKIVELNNENKLALVEINTNEGTTKFEVPYSDIQK
jgi:transcription antitermination factor NusG